MDNLKNNLKTIGLSDDEIELYLTALETGAQTVLELARRSGIPRTTVYLLIDSLTAKGLLTLSADGKKKLYIPASPQKLVEIASQQKQELHKTVSSLYADLPELEAVYNTRHSKPKISYYDGVEGVKKIYEDTLKYPKMYVHCMSQEAIEIMGDYLEKYFIRIARKMIHTKEIVSDSELDKKYQQEYSTSRNKIVCIPRKYTTNTDYIIYGDSVAFITYKDKKPIGVVIEDKEIANFEKIRFNMVWELFGNADKQDNSDIVDQEPRTMIARPQE